MLAFRFGLRVRAATIIPSEDAHGIVLHESPLRGIRLDIDGKRGCALRGPSVSASPAQLLNVSFSLLHSGVGTRRPTMTRSMN